MSQMRSLSSRFDHDWGAGHTLGMKTAVSLPDELFEQANRHARRVGKSRSQLFREALKDYLARHAPDEVTEAIDRVVAEVGAPDHDFRRTAVRLVLERVDW